MISPQRMLLSSMKELSTSEKGRRGGRGGGVGRSYLRSAVGSSSMMNVGTGLITISSSLATSAAVTTEGTSAGTRSLYRLRRWNWRACWYLHRGSNRLARSARIASLAVHKFRSFSLPSTIERDDLTFSDMRDRSVA